MCRATKAGLPAIAQCMAEGISITITITLIFSLDRYGQALKGKAAIANARLAYQRYEQVLGTEHWATLAAAGGRPQRPLWASTGVKNPTYDDTMYVVDLAAPGVVNTMPEATLNACADHGAIAGDSIDPRNAHAKEVLDDLAAIGIDYDDDVQVLEDEAVAKFEASWADVERLTHQILTASPSEESL